MKLKSLGTGHHHHCFSILIWEPINSIPLAGEVSGDFFLGGVNHMVFREKRWGGGSVIANRVERGGTVENWLLIRGGSFEHYEPLKEGGSGKWHCDTTKILWPLPPGDNDRSLRGVSRDEICVKTDQNVTLETEEKDALFWKSLSTKYHYALSYAVLSSARVEGFFFIQYSALLA